MVKNLKNVGFRVHRYWPCRGKVEEIWDKIDTRVGIAHLKRVSQRQMMSEEPRPVMELVAHVVVRCPRMSSNEVTWQKMLSRLVRSLCITREELCLIRLIILLDVIAATELLNHLPIEVNLEPNSASPSPWLYFQIAAAASRNLSRSSIVSDLISRFTYLVKKWGKDTKKR